MLIMITCRKIPGATPAQAFENPTKNVITASENMTLGVYFKSPSTKV